MNPLWPQAPYWFGAGRTVIPGIPNQPMGRESRWLQGARMAPGPRAAALCLLGFDVEVFPQRHVPNGLASADGKHKRHHVRVKACETWEKLTRMFQAVHRGGTKVVPCRRPAEPSRPTYGTVTPAQSLSTGKATNRSIF